MTRYWPRSRASRGRSRTSRPRRKDTGSRPDVAGTNKRTWCASWRKPGASSGSCAAERDDLAARLEASPGEWRERYEAAARELRGLKHAEHWTQAIGGDLAEKVPVAKVWEQVGYQPGDELPGPDQIREWVTAARDSAPYLFRPQPAGEPPAGPSGTPPMGQPPRGWNAGPGGPQPPGATPTNPTRYQVGDFDGGGRGRRDLGTDQLVVTRSQMRDPGFMLKHTRALAAASKAGNLTIRDE